MGAEEPPEPLPFRFSRITRHETRITAFVVARHGAAMVRHGRHGRPEPLLPCSRLFGIVQQKILRLSQCPLSVLTGNGAGKVFTNHKTRDKNHGLYAFHQTRETNHESRNFAARSRLPCPTFPTISRYSPALPGKKIASAKHETRTLLPPDYDFLPNHNGSISHYPPECVQCSIVRNAQFSVDIDTALRARSAAANTE